MDTILGIDLGTTNSVVSILRDNQPFVIPVEDELRTLPSVVGIDASGGLLVGTPARNQAVLGPERTILSVKRQMGSDDRLTLGDQQFTPQEISAIILRTLKERAERYLGESVSKAVITVPAFFTDDQRRATREAGELAGLEVVRIINEPTAAALTYEADTQQSRQLLVYDLGGGTFDVSIVRIEAGVVEVLSSHGNTKLGGDDFDQLLLDHVCDQFQEESGFDLRTVPAARSRLRQAVEEAKKTLSSEAYTTIEEAFLAEHQGRPLSLSMTIDRSDYEDLIRSLVEETIGSVDKALADAQRYAKDIDTVILVGGSTRTPLVQEVVEERLGQKPYTSVDPDLCVAMGAAIQGGLIGGVEVGPVLVDITPHTLGVRCLGEINGILTNRRFVALIPRNTALPARRSEVFCTNYDGQETVVVDIYQGEHEDSSLNQFVGTFRLDGLDKEARAGNELLIRFELDLSGTLNACAIERATSLETSITIDNAITQFTAKNREEALERIGQMFGEDPQATQATDENADAVGSQSRFGREAGEGLSEPARRRREELDDLARRLNEHELSDEDRADVDDLFDRLKTAFEEDQADDFDRLRDELEDILFYVQQK